MKKIWWSFSVFIIMCPILTSSCNTVKMSKDTEYGFAAQGIYAFLDDFNKSIDNISASGSNKINVADDYWVPIKEKLLSNITNKSYTIKNYGFYFLQDEDNLKKLDLKLSYEDNSKFISENGSGWQDTPIIKLTFNKISFHSNRFKKRYQMKTGEESFINIWESDLSLSDFDIAQINSQISGQDFSLNQKISMNDYDYYQKQLNQILYPFILKYLSDWEILHYKEDDSYWASLLIAYGARLLFYQEIDGTLKYIDTNQGTGPKEEEFLNLWVGYNSSQVYNADLLHDINIHLTLKNPFYRR